MQFWEYELLKIEPGGFFGGKVDANDLLNRLSEMGKKGWELASTFETNVSNGGSRDVVLIFKRPASIPAHGKAPLESRGGIPNSVTNITAAHRFLAFRRHSLGSPAAASAASTRVRISSSDAMRSTIAVK